MADLFGTSAGDTIYGTDGDDSISGLDGDDQLRSRKGNDRLDGGAGNDSLNGGEGADTMLGGSGDDTYYVDHPGDFLSEETVLGVDDGGKDRVYSTISYTLARFFEKLELSGAATIDGTGNDLANRITGNTAANTLTGGSGNDTLVGGDGNDRLIGGADKDSLTGGTGADTFVFGPADATSTDTVTDFSAEDWVGIVASDYGLSTGSGLLADGKLDPAYFATVSGSSTVQGTASGHGQFVYNTTTRALLWDADGKGTLSAGIALATFNSGVVLSAANFAVTGAAPGVGQISIGDVTITEGDAGTKTATFTVTRTGTAAFSVGFATADGTAKAGSDYIATSGTLSFAAGQAAQTVAVTINGDTAVEGNETFFLNLVNASNGTLIDGQAIGTITNDDSASPVVGNISINDVSIAEGNSGTKTATFTVSRTGTAAFTLDFATADGTAKAGSDYASKSGTLSFAAGEGTKTVSVTINGDTTYEGSETFFLNLTKPSNGGVLADGQGLGTITNDDSAPTSTSPTVVAIHDTRALGSPDPSGLAYVPASDTLFLCDSEHEESPFYSPINLYALRTDGTLKQSYSLTKFTTEATGLTFDRVTGNLFISDDDQKKVFWVNPANPTVKLGEFLTKPIGGDDPEDVAIDRDGHLFIVNGVSRTIVETNNTGTQVLSKINLPSEISDPEALVYDPGQDVFYIGGGFSYMIWKIDHRGTILSRIDVLSNYRNTVGGGRVHVKDLELAPSSDPNDHPDKLSLYVADYGSDQVNDGRLLELNVGDLFWV